MDHVALMVRLEPNTCRVSFGFLHPGRGPPYLVNGGNHIQNLNLVSGRGYCERSFATRRRSRRENGYFSNNFLTVRSKTSNLDSSCLKLKLLDEMTEFQTRISHSPPNHLSGTEMGDKGGQSACDWIAPSPSKLLFWPETAVRRWKNLNIPKEPYELAILSWNANGRLKLRGCREGLLRRWVLKGFVDVALIQEHFKKDGSPLFEIF